MTTGAKTLMLANMKLSKMRFDMSEGMLLAAGPEGKNLWIFNPNDDEQPGMKVK